MDQESTRRRPSGSDGVEFPVLVRLEGERAAAPRVLDQQIAQPFEESETRRHFLHTAYPLDPAAR